MYMFVYTKPFKHRNVFTVNKNKSTEHVTDHILRYHVNRHACCMYTVVFMDWDSIEKWALLRSASHRGQTGSCSPSNNAPCVKRVSQIRKCVTATSLLLKLKEDCHVCTDRQLAVWCPVYGSIPPARYTNCPDGDSRDYVRQYLF